MVPQKAVNPAMTATARDQPPGRAQVADHGRLSRAPDGTGHTGVLVLRRGTWLPVYPSTRSRTGGA